MREDYGMRMIFLLSFTSLALPLLADCPPAPNIKAAEGRILAEIGIAPDELTARQLSQGLWALWIQAPDAHAQSLLDKGMRAREGYDFATAYDAFSALTEYCPDYAEGYNQRAFVHFLRQEYEPALVDLEKAIARSPRHVAAIAGKALTLIGLDRNDEAQVVLRQALKLNPWLSERVYLTDPKATDL